MFEQKIATIEMYMKRYEAQKDNSLAPCYNTA